MSAILWTNVTIILSEEIWGAHASPALPLVLLANAPWFIFPVVIIARMWREHPFTREAEEAKAYAAGKACLIALAESLWGELRADGVDVIAPIAGATGTPAYWSGLKGGKSNVPVMEPGRWPASPCADWDAAGVR